MPTMRASTIDTRTQTDLTDTNGKQQATQRRGRRGRGGRRGTATAFTLERPQGASGAEWPGEAVKKKSRQLTAVDAVPFQSAEAVCVRVPIVIVGPSASSRLG